MNSQPHRYPAHSPIYLFHDSSSLGPKVNETKFTFHYCGLPKSDSFVSFIPCNSDNWEVFLKSDLCRLQFTSPQFTLLSIFPSPLLVMATSTSTPYGLLGFPVLFLCSGVHCHILIACACAHTISTVLSQLYL